MRNILILLAVGALVYAVFLRDSRFDTDLVVQGARFQQVKNVSRGGVDNYFYTRDGAKFEYATEFVQIYAFDEEVPDASRDLVLDRARKGYGLTESSDEIGRYFGTFKRGGINMVAFGSDFLIDYRPSFSVLLRVAEGEEQIADARRQRKIITQDLANLESYFK